MGSIVWPRKAVDESPARPTGLPNLWSGFQPTAEPTAFQAVVVQLEVAQFVYLLLNNKKIRDVIDTITSKVVLILGRFTPPERKAVLDAIRSGLRWREYLPVVVDFDKPANRNFTETVLTLAHLARFIVADITEPRSVPQELQSIVSNLRSVPVQPLLQISATSTACSRTSNPATASLRRSGIPTLTT